MMKTTRREGRAAQESARKDRVQKQQKKEQERASKLAKAAAEQTILPASAKEGRWWSFLKISWQWGALLFAILLFYFDPFPSIVPHVLVEKGEPFYRANPFSVPFKISNQSDYELQDLEYECIQLEAFSPQGAVAYRNRFLPKDRFIESLKRGHAATKWCTVLSNTAPTRSLVTVDFMVRVFYRPWFIFRFIVEAIGWGRFTEDFRFIVKYDEEGFPRLLEQPEVTLPDVQYGDRTNQQ